MNDNIRSSAGDAGHDEKRPAFATLRRVLGTGHRVFFLSAALFAVLAVAVWLVWLAFQAAGAAPPAMPFAPPPPLWHAHEMIFGYATAALGGFFLTAVPSWTGTGPARAGYVAGVAGIWLAGRVAIWFSGSLDPVFVAVVDLAFLPLLASKIALQLVRRPKPQNLVFLALLALIWSGDLMVHLDWTGVLHGSAGRGLRVGLLGITAVIAVIGGRVTPAFTRNAMQGAGVQTNLPRSRKVFEIIGILTAIATPLLVAFAAPVPVAGGAALISGLAQSARLAGWRTVWTRRSPILWSLHLGFAMLALGHAVLGLAWLGFANEVAALHILGIGAVGGMTLAVMSRASLGHSGRALVAPRPVAAAYALVAIATLLRVLATAGGPGWYLTGVFGAGGLWVLAFSLFLAALWPVLTGQSA